MRTFSTPESAVKGEITKLAIVECVVCVVLYIGIGLYFHTFRHLYLAIAIAPFMLFRTDEASEWGVRTMTTLTRRMEALCTAIEHRMPAEYGDNERPPLLRLFTKLLVYVGLLTFQMVIMLPLVPFLVRTVSVVRSLCLTPLHAVGQMPVNWVRQATCTDFAHPPEVLPTELITTSPNSVYEHFIGNIRTTKDQAADLHERLVAAFMLLVFGIGFLVPPILYRISFKATAVAYLPFIWVAHTTVAATLPLKVRLQRIRDGEFEKTRRWLSGFILALVAVKATLVMKWIDASTVNSEFAAQVAALNALAGGKALQWWHATLVFDAVLTFCLLWFADAALARLDAQAWSESIVANTISTATFIRATVAIVTMGYAFLVAARQVVPPAVTAAFSV